MIQAIRDRRLWAALLAFLLLGPVFGVLFVNRGWMALAYLLAIVGITAGVMYAIPGETAEALDTAFGLISLAGVVHGIVIAWRRQPDEPLRWYARWQGFLALLSIPALLVLVRFTVLEPFFISAGSMSPTLNQGDFIFASRRAYDFATPQRGDLIVFNAMGGTPFVKRVVGLPGDKVQMKKGVLHLNGEPVVRKETVPFPFETGTRQRDVPQFIETMPGGRSHATLDLHTDSVWDETGVYDVTAGCYFVLGDNRDNSHDSRVPDMSCVAEDDVVGKVWLRYWNGRTRSPVLDYPE